MIKKVNIKEIKENPNNPRYVVDSKFKKLVKSIKEFPEMLEKRPIVVDENMIVLGGNMRLKACKSAGLFEVYIHQAIGWSEEQKKQFIIKDNVGFGDWDWDILANEWDVVQLNEWGLSFLPEFDDVQLDAEEDNYTEPEQMKVDVVLGDLIEIGEHRLLCGDSTDADQVAKLMSGNKASLVYTDPPYGVSYKSNYRTKTEKFNILENDNVFLTEWINILPLFSNGFVFVWTSWKVLKEWIEFCEPIGKLSNMIIWNKGGGGIGDLQKTFLTDFEVALCYNRGAKIIGKRLGSVWSVGKDDVNKYLHPTQKPVELAAMAIQNVSKKNKIVLDLFLGSGSTMVASHQLQRKCYGMELDPKYCQVIIDRMLKLDPDLKVKINGKKYE